MGEHLLFISQYVLVTGVLLIIKNIMSLDAGQALNVCSANNSGGIIEMFQLDTLNTHIAHQNVCIFLQTIGINTDSTVFLLQKYCKGCHGIV